jgi:hypothetical protein
LFCSFGEIIHGIVLEHTNAKGTTCSGSVAETSPKKIIFGQFCEFLILGIFVCASVLIFFFILTCKKKNKKKKKIGSYLWWDIFLAIWCK